jgi:mannose PTS system EIIC component
MWGDVIIVSLIGGFITLDRSAAFQIMISRPLVCAPVIGFILGHTTVGIIVGGMLELIYIGRAPLGGYVPPHECLAAILCTAAVLISTAAPSEFSHVPSSTPARSLVALSVLISFPPAHLGSILESRRQRFNNYFSRQARLAVTSGRPERLPLLNLAGIAITYASSVAFILVCLPILVLIIRCLHPILPPQAHSALVMMYFALPLIGVAAVLSSITLKKSRLAFAVSYAAAVILLSL